MAYIEGDASNNVLDGTRFADTIYAFDGDDTVNGGAGDDSMYGGNGDFDLLRFGYSGWWGDIIENGRTYVIDNINHVATTTYLVGSGITAHFVTDTNYYSGFEIIEGGGGQNIFYSNGSDVYTGTSGLDIYYAAPTRPDPFAFSGVSAADDMINMPFGLFLDFYPGTVTTTWTVLGVEHTRTATFSGVHTVHGGIGNDTIYGSSISEILYGDEGNDILIDYSSDFRDTAPNSPDVLVGGTGDDVFVLTHALTSITELAGEGKDTIEAYGFSIDLNLARYDNVENVTLTKNPLDLFGSGPAINATGDAAANRLTGNGAANILTGNGGNDVLLGGAGNDNMFGGIGRDYLRGDSGRDEMTGGTGGDTFDFNRLADMGRTATTRDVIKDFTHDNNAVLSDHIDLKTIDANGSTAGHGTFHFIATMGSAFTHTRGDLRWYQIDNTNNALDKTIIEGDVNGDGRADFQIELTGLKALVAADFILV